MIDLTIIIIYNSDDVNQEVWSFNSPISTLLFKPAHYEKKEAHELNGAHTHQEDRFTCSIKRLNV